MSQEVAVAMGPDCSSFYSVVHDRLIGHSMQYIEAHCPHPAVIAYVDSVDRYCIDIVLYWYCIDIVLCCIVLILYCIVLILYWYCIVLCCIVVRIIMLLLRYYYYYCVLRRLETRGGDSVWWLPEVRGRLLLSSHRNPKEEKGRIRQEKKKQTGEIWAATSIAAPANSLLLVQKSPGLLLVQQLKSFLHHILRSCRPI